MRKTVLPLLLSIVGYLVIVFLTSSLLNNTLYQSALELLLVVGMYYLYNDMSRVFETKGKGVRFKVIFLLPILFFVVGLLLSVPFYGLQDIEASINSSAFNFEFLLFGLVFLLKAASEELFYRGMIIDISKASLRIEYAVIISSFLFALSHPNPSSLAIGSLSFVLYFLMGTMYSIIRLRYGMITAILTHTLFNIVALASGSGKAELQVIHVGSNETVELYDIIIQASLYLLIVIIMTKSNKAMKN